MYNLGAVRFGLVWWPLAIVNLAITVLTNIFYMYWVCPYCGHYSLACVPPVSIGSPANTSKPKSSVPSRGPFTLGTIVVGLGWFLSLIAAAYLLIIHFSWWIVALLVAFCTVGFWLLAESSKKPCEGCETVDCPRHPGITQAKA